MVILKTKMSLSYSNFKFDFLKKIFSYIGITIIVLLSGCYSDEALDIPVNDDNIVILTELDQYIEEEFTKKYGMAIRYRFVDRYVNPTDRVSPPKLEMVRPMLDFVQNFWIDPFLEVPNGEAFFRDHVPAEIVFLGGLIFNANGTVTLGTADAGAQITFTNVNAIDLTDLDWRTLQLQTVYHEFAHIVHQRYKLPPSFERITPSGYTSAGSWFNLLSDEALQRGFVSPYASSSPNEDFAETVSYFLFDPDFDDNFIINKTDCETVDCENRNEGRLKLREKMTSISDHYEKVTGVNLNEVRAAVQSRL